jgi:hypothetical protein
MSSLYQVLKNGKFMGIIETNYVWASRYWAARCRPGSPGHPGVRYTLREV